MKKITLAIIWAVTGLWSAIPGAQAAPPELTLPIDCAIGTDCWVVNYVDRDPSEGTRDYTCQYRTYDGHKGTDFVIADMAAMRAGVDVLASAPGVVRALRNNMADVNIKKIGRKAVKGRECGNGVLLAHDDGWETQYCHMRRGSISVRVGDRVQQGDALGLVGLSGFTQMPHSHISVRHNGVVVDPFSYTGTDLEKTRCESPAQSVQHDDLWRDDIARAIGPPQSTIYLSGFSDGVPNAESIRDGNHGIEVLAGNAKALVFWADMFWVEPTDKITLSIRLPDGSMFVSNTASPPRIQARRFIFVGKKNTGKLWPPGQYLGTAEIKRSAKDGSIRTITTSRTLQVQ